MSLATAQASDGSEPKPQPYSELFELIQISAHKAMYLPSYEVMSPILSGTR